MDARAIFYWLKAARKKAVADFRQQIVAARIAQAKDDDYRAAIGELDNRILRLEIGDDEFYRRNRKALKEISGG